MTQGRSVRLLGGLLGGVALVGAVLVCGAGGAWWFGTAAFTRFAVVSELDDYSERIAATGLAESDRAELDFRIGELQERVRSGELVLGFGAFVSHDLVFEKALEDGTLTSEEVAALHEELTAMGRGS